MDFPAQIRSCESSSRGCVIAKQLVDKVQLVSVEFDDKEVTRQQPAELEIDRAIRKGQIATENRHARENASIHSDGRRFDAIANFALTEILRETTQSKFTSKVNAQEPASTG